MAMRTLEGARLRLVHAGDRLMRKGIARPLPPPVQRREKTALLAVVEALDG